MEEPNLLHSPRPRTESANFAPAPPPLPFGRPRPKRRWPLVMGIAVTFILLAAVVTTLIAGSRLYAGVKEGEAALERAQAAAVALDFETASAELGQARRSFQRVQVGLKLIRWMHPLPWVGDQVKAVSVIIDAGINSIAAIEEALTIARDVLGVMEEARDLLDENALPEGEYTFDDLSQDTKTQLLRTLHNAHPQLVQMQVRLSLAQEQLNELQTLHNVVPDLLEAIEPFQTLLPELISGVNILVPFAASVEELAGVGQDRVWMMVFLNNTELRPGGGFMGVYGLMTIRDGEIIEMLVDDTYAVDRAVEDIEEYTVTPPEPIRTYLGLDTWYFRDANWSPDFMTSMQTAVQLFRQEKSVAGEPVPEVHGVIGFTPTLAEAVLEMIGPVTVDGIEFTSENITQELEFQVEFGFVEAGVAYEERKAIVGRLTEKVMEELFTLPVSRWGEFFEVLNTAFAQKQLALYSASEDAQGAFEDNGWSGVIDARKADDVLMVVDANLGALKTDAVMERDIFYTVVPDGDGYLATTQIEYRNTGTFTLTTTTYLDYVRVYAPLGSELVSTTGNVQSDVVTQEDAGLTSFGAYTSIRPGEVDSISFTYRLPPETVEAMNDGVYQLHVLKQLGASNNALTLDIDFGKKVKAADPGEESTDFGDTRYHLNTILDQDTVFTVEL